MNAERWSRIEQLYHEAAALDTADRAGFLLRACGGDQPLLSEIESLLEEDEPFLEEPALAVAARLVSDEILDMTGRTFGVYRIDGLLGAGGMGDVYRAHDTMLGRDVAIKILPEAFSDDPERLARFKQEAQFLASLSHPNIAAIYGIHESEGVRGLILELVDGETLADRIKRGPVPLYEAIRIVRQIGEGLDAAHQRGIVHRDLKPSNIKIGKDGTTKILDFGLATSAGREEFKSVCFGTASYMSPEQVRGDTIDKRADIWAFGCVFFEMLTGQPANALVESGPRWDLIPPSVPPGISALLRRCLDEDPKRRRRDIGDVLADLDDALRAELPSVGRWSDRRALLAVAIGLMCAAAAFLAGWIVRSRDADVTSELPRWHRLTFNEGFVHTARFGPDGQTVLYSASWDGKPFQIFATTTYSPESRALDLPPAGLLAVSATGELALALSCVYVAAQGGCNGTLARAPLLGGAPRPLANDVRSADWGPNDSLAAVVSGHLEAPLGTTVAERASYVRMSPDGQRLASAEREADSWAVVVREGRSRQVLSRGWTFISGLAWARDGTALFVSGVGPADQDDAVLRIELDGTARAAFRARPRIRVLDAGQTDRLLIDQSTASTRAWVYDPTVAGGRRDLSWLGSSVVDAISNDGKKVLLTVRMGPTLEGGQRLESLDLYPIYVRPTDGGPATRLGAGYGHALSDDGQWALTSTREDQESRFVLYPLEPGSPKTLDRGGLDMRATSNPTTSASFAGSDRIAFVAVPTNGAPQTFVQSIAGGPPVPVEHEPGRLVSPVAPDGDRFISQRPDGSLWMASLAPGKATRLPYTLQPNQFIRQWSEDGRQLFVLTIADDRWVFTKVEAATGKVQPHREIMRDRLENRMFGSSVRISRDGAVIAGTSNRIVSDLFLIEGVK